MPSAGKNKGNTGERIIANFLTELYQAKFIRVPNSGAFLGGANHHRQQLMDSGQVASFRADIIPPSDMRGLVIESKFYKEFPFSKLLKNEKIPLLDGWIKQLEENITSQDFSVVVFRINRQGSFAVFHEKWHAQLQVGNYARYQHYIVTDFNDLFTVNRDVIRNIVKTQPS
jgi:hypothetical protein